MHMYKTINKSIYCRPPLVCYIGFQHLASVRWWAYPFSQHTTIIIDFYFVFYLLIVHCIFLFMLNPRSLHTLAISSKTGLKITCESGDTMSGFPNQIASSGLLGFLVLAHSTNICSRSIFTSSSGKEVPLSSLLSALIYSFAPLFYPPLNFLLHLD